MEHVAQPSDLVGRALHPHDDRPIKAGSVEGHVRVDGSKRGDGLAAGEVDGACALVVAKGEPRPVGGRHADAVIRELESDGDEQPGKEEEARDEGWDVEGATREIVEQVVIETLVQLVLGQGRGRGEVL